MTDTSNSLAGRFKKVIFGALAVVLSVSAIADQIEDNLRNSMTSVIDEIVQESKLSGPFESIARRSLENMLNHDKMIANLALFLRGQKLGSEQDARMIGLSAIGLLNGLAMSRLSQEDLFLLMKTQQEVTTKMTDFECAQYFRKQETNLNGRGRWVYEIASTMGLERFAFLMRTTEKSFVLLREGRNEAEWQSAKEVDSIRTEFESNFRKFVRNNPHVLSFFNSGKTFATAPDAEVCRVGSATFEFVLSGEKDVVKKRLHAYIKNQLF